MIEDYRKARKIGRKQVGKALAEGRHPYPPALDEQMCGLPFVSETAVGCVEIPLGLIVGTKTKGRQNAFSEGFMPLEDDDTEFAAKWSHLYDVQVAEGFRDPILVYECLQRFYVQEGNKRVSVARYVGMPSITAHVTRVMPVPGADMEDEVALYEEFQQFYRVAPMYDIVLTHNGEYARLAHLLGKDLHTPWPESDVRRLRTLFYLFYSAFGQQGSKRLDCSESEAFLLFLQANADQDLWGLTPLAINKLVRRMWNEFVVAAQPNPIAFVSDAPAIESGIVTKVVTKLKPAKPLSVAFIYDRTPASSGWVALHERGQRKLASRMDSKVCTFTFEGCTSDDSFSDAVSQAVANGCSLVFTTSPRQMAQTHRAALAYPSCEFFNCSINLTSSAVRTYYARMYEVKFLMGALAASLSQSHQLGYVAFSPINGAVSEINAFALGAALVDPYATVHLKWLSASPGWRNELLDAGVDVVCDRDFTDPTSPDEPVGLYVIADGRVLPVAQPVWDWEKYYELLLRGVLAGSDRMEAKLHKGHAINYWWGMRANVVRLELEDGVALGQRRLIDMLTRALMDGQLEPFNTQLVSQDGTSIRSADKPSLSDKKIASMSWLNVNIAGSLPTLSQLSQGGRADVEAAGVVASRFEEA